MTAAAGFLLLTILPEVLPDPFIGILIPVMVYAVGGGLLEVIVSPIVEACPTKHKESAMSMLHSFYCRGHVGVVLLATLFFGIFGIENWKILALLWALVPLGNLFLFARAVYGKFGEKMDLNRFMRDSTLLCIAAYLIVALSPWPFLGLIGCGITGFSVGIMWPGTFSQAASRIRNGGTAMFALFALAGDVGCGGGPTIVGLASGALGNNLRLGILCGVIFPLLMLLGLGIFGRTDRKNAS